MRASTSSSIRRSCSAVGPGSIGEQLAAFAKVSPIAPLVEVFAQPFPVEIGFLIAIAEIAVGLGALTGLALPAGGRRRVRAFDPVLADRVLDDDAVLLRSRSAVRGRLADACPRRDRRAVHDGDVVRTPRRRGPRRPAGVDRSAASSSRRVSWASRRWRSRPWPARWERPTFGRSRTRPAGGSSTAAAGARPRCRTHTPRRRQPVARLLALAASAEPVRRPRRPASAGPVIAKVSQLASRAGRDVRRSREPGIRACWSSSRTGRSSRSMRSARTPAARSSTTVSSGFLSVPVSRGRLRPAERRPGRQRAGASTVAEHPDPRRQRIGRSRSRAEALPRDCNGGRCRAIGCAASRC